ncbi:hypothetical protein [Arthrospiribacter ruber]|uniref:Uncharacterized protein n=1 Tax=Arthrospiribacter ruber TaxID=2487934 RepID=A0A951IT19_9BACT|nr:hypothetical protein [Arthrospiribacter ruber]MBW3466950.1 hypothetical protein [Arthrospiribacter ruber]
MAKKHNIKSIGLLFLMSLCLMSCSESYSDQDLELAVKSAGKNRGEIERVLYHYSQEKEDSLKYVAARLLIINMTKQQGIGYYSEEYENFTKHVYDSLENHGEDMFLSKNQDVNKMLRTNVFNDIWDHYAAKLGDPRGYRFSYQADIQNISAEMLIENIDYAFKAWELPWSRKYSFDEFCKFILPYRYADEPLSHWRKLYWEELEFIVDSLKSETDPITVTALINEQFKKYYTWGNEKLNGVSRGRIKPMNLLRGGITGNCHDQVGIGYSAMRALGIATSEVIIPNWGYAGTSGHTFNVVLDPHKKRWVDFHAGDINPIDNEVTLMPKVFLLDNFALGNTSNQLSNFENLTDLTSQFTKTVDINLDLETSDKYPEYAYLCVFNNFSWQPIMWGEIKENKVTFNNMGVDKVYLPAVYIENQLVPIHPPIQVDSTTKTTILEPSDSKFISTRLFRKYFLQEKTKIERSKDLVGGKFQVANKKDFSDAKTIFTIPDFASYIPIEKCTEEVNGRYVRFLFPPVDRDFKNGPAYLAFYPSDVEASNPLKGKYIASEQINTENLDAIFDDDLLTYVVLLPNESSLLPKIRNHIPITDKNNSLWVGMDLGTPTKINRVGFCPRNDKNNIYPGLHYELFYWDKKWISLGRKQATDHFLNFDDIPYNSLMLLKCHSEGVEERIFTLDHEKKQRWW